MVERKQKIFIKEYSETMNISKACDKCGISRTTFYRWKRDYSSFAMEVLNIESGLLDSVTSGLFIAMQEKNENGFPSKQAVGVMMHINTILNNKANAKKLELGEEKSSVEILYKDANERETIKISYATDKNALFKLSVKELVKTEKKIINEIGKASWESFITYISYYDKKRHDEYCKEKELQKGKTNE